MGWFPRRNLKTAYDESAPLNKPKAKLSWKQNHLSGWRFGIVSGSILATCVLLLNVIIVAIFTSKKWSGENSQNTLFEASCDTTRQYNIGIHLVINILSTTLLGASNYGMQCLVAPTRSEIDASHSKRQWLDIGVPSLRNLRSINRKRLFLWILLAGSSLPLHLM